jgi:pyruvate formate lyase activating enzyme
MSGMALRAPRFFSLEAEGLVRCGLCPHKCAIKSGTTGVCGVRGSKNGVPLIPFYGFASALALDPIEKKPLYHFFPGTQILSVGFAGCNLRCPFCQNWRISQNTDIEGRWISPEELVSSALRANSASIAYTYSEPLVHPEFLLDTMVLARRQGIANVLVSSGCVNSEGAKEVLALTDAANIDLKCFSEETYAKVLGGNLQTVLDFIRLARETGVHVEITTLVVPGINDGEAELEGCTDFIAGLSDAIPYHLSAYHPDYRWNAQATEADFLLRAAARAQKKLRYVYTGNISGGGGSQQFSDTLCPYCGKVLVRRRGYRAESCGLAEPVPGERAYRCAACGEKSPLAAKI